MALFSISYLSATYIFPNDLLVIILNKCSLDYQDLYMQLPFAGNFGVNCRVNDHVTGHFQGESRSWTMNFTAILVETGKRIDLQAKILYIDEFY